MDRLRSCYEAEVRFFRDDPRTTRVRWFFVSDNTPFIPYPTAFASTIWDSDPKGNIGIGEQHEPGRTWVNGAPPAAFPADHVCGTADQWLNGLAMPPVQPVPVNDQGVPLCCFAGLPPAPPVVKPGGLVMNGTSTFAGGGGAAGGGVVINGTSQFLV